MTDAPQDQKKNPYADLPQYQPVDSERAIENAKIAYDGLIENIRAGKVSGYAIVAIGTGEHAGGAKVCWGANKGFARTLAADVIGALATKAGCACGDPKCQVFMSFLAIAQLAENFTAGVPMEVVDSDGEPVDLEATPPPEKAN